MGLLGLAALTSERRFFGERESRKAHHAPGAAHLLYAVPAWLTGLFLVHHYPAPHASAALLAAGAVAAGLAAVLNATALGGISLAYLPWARAPHRFWTSPPPPISSSGRRLAGLVSGRRCFLTDT
jgi:hypothetical protein